MTGQFCPPYPLKCYGDGDDICSRGLPTVSCCNFLGLGAWVVKTTGMLWGKEMTDGNLCPNCHGSTLIIAAWAALHVLHYIAPWYCAVVFTSRWWRYGSCVFLFKLKFFAQDLEENCNIIEKKNQQLEERMNTLMKVRVGSIELPLCFFLRQLSQTKHKDKDINLRTILSQWIMLSHW